MYDDRDCRLTIVDLLYVPFFCFYVPFFCLLRFSARFSAFCCPRFSVAMPPRDQRGQEPISRRFFGSRPL
jgi:hypothetical protein